MARFSNRQRNEGFWRFERWGAPMVGVLIVLLALVGISATQDEPGDSAEEVVAEHASDHRWGGGWGRHRGGHGMFGRHGPDPERAKDHMQYAAGWMLRRLDVAEDAQERIQSRLDSAFDELMPLIQAHKGSRDSWLEAMLGADEVDREGLEAQRRDTLDAADRATQIISDAFADIAEELTPEQRSKIAEKIRSRHRH